MRFSVPLAALLGAGLTEAQYLISELSFGYAGRYVGAGPTQLLRIQQLMCLYPLE